ncbi:MAG: HAD family phosphatase [Ignavibacteria bacterium]|nr:HAD family phosphatase [Ignavibacteria bacterium]
MQAYKALIFDLGNVVFNVDMDLISIHWAERSGIPYEVIKKYFEADKNFDKFERGDLTEEQYRKITNENLEMNLNEKDFDDGLTALYLDETHDINSLLKELKMNYRIIALSNTNIIHKRVWRKKYKDTMDEFEKIFSSHEINTRKPETEPYLIALDYLKMKPEEVIFLDDKPENIEPAKTLGMKTITVKSPIQMRKELNEIFNPK